MSCKLEHVQGRSMDVRADAATLDAPTSSPTDAATSSYPTEAARRTAFSEDFTPELVRWHALPQRSSSST